MAHDRTDVVLHFRWRATPSLALVAVLATTPAILLWAAALAGSLGFGHPLEALPAPAAAPTRLDRLLTLGIFLAVTVGGPLLAFVLSALAIADAEVRVEHWEISARLRVPAPPWHLAQLLALLLLVAGALLFAAMVGHLAADCLLAGDC